MDVNAHSNPPSPPKKGRIGGVAAREVDPPLHSREWVKVGVSLTEMRELASTSEHIGKSMMADYDKFAAFDGYIESQTGPEAPEIARCRIKYERVTPNCHWGQRFVFQRTGEQTGEVVYVESDMSDDVSATCREFADCVRKAWQGRESPFPEKFSSDYFAASAGVFNISGDGPMTIEEYKSRYEEHLTRQQDIYDDNLGSSTGAAREHALASGLAKIEDAKFILETLNEEE